MRGRLSRFFIGRYGVDALGKFIVAVSLVVLIASQILRAFVSSLAGTIVWWLAVLMLVLAYYRMFSRNIYRRSAENRKYLDATSGIRSRVRLAAERFRQRKDYKFYKCPSCHVLLRLPKGKGKIQITCKKCGNRFARKT